VKLDSITEIQHAATICCVQKNKIVFLYLQNNPQQQPTYLNTSFIAFGVLQTELNFSRISVRLIFFIEPNSIPHEIHYVGREFIQTNEQFSPPVLTVAAPVV